MRHFAILLTTLGASLSGIGGNPSLLADPVERGTLDLGKLQLRFEPNEGQTDARVKYFARGADYGLYLTASEAVLVLHSSAPGAPANSPDEVSLRSVLHMSLVDANPDPGIAGLDRLEGVSHYIGGSDRSRWRRNVPHYARIEYSQVYPGIDLIYYGQQRSIEFDFVVAPGADPSAVEIAFDGQDSMEIDGDGNLILRADAGKVIQRAPVAYQLAEGGERCSVEARYLMQGGGRIAFEIGDYDVSRQLVIDPILDYSTFVGGRGLDEANGIAVDANGNAYITGRTTSADFPTHRGAYDEGFDPASSDAYVFKLNADGSGLIYSTFLGGEDERGGGVGEGIAVDSEGNACIIGRPGFGYLTTPNAVQRSSGGGAVWVAKLDATGSDILYATFLTGSNGASAGGIAVDGGGDIYVTGGTGSAGFPRRNAFQSNLLGSAAFITRLDPDALRDSLVYSTFLAGSEGEFGVAVAADDDGNVVVIGMTSSSQEGRAPLPTRNAFQPEPGRTAIRTAFVAKFDTTQVGDESLIFSTYFGGSGHENGGSGDIALDEAGNIYVTGGTSSSDFPTTVRAFQETDPPSRDAFVAKFAPHGDLIFATYLGGRAVDQGNGIAVDAQGHIHVAGTTASADFPTKNALQSEIGGDNDLFITVLAADGASLIDSTYLGGFTYEYFGGLDVDSSGTTYVTGRTSTSTRTLFPTTLGAYQERMRGTVDIFVAKISHVIPCESNPGIARIDRVAPDLVSSMADKVVAIEVQGIEDSHTARIGGKPVIVMGINARGMTVLVESLPVGLHDVEIICGESVVATLENAIESALPVILDRVEPDRIAVGEAEPIEIFGANMRPETIIKIGGIPLTDQVNDRDGTRARGLSPIRNSASTVDITASDLRGTVRFSNAVSYYVVNLCDRSLLRLDSVTPTSMPTQTATEFSIRGSGFRSGHTVSLDGNEPLSMVRVSTELIRATFALDAGVYDVQLSCPTGVVTRLTDAVEVGDPPVILDITPSLSPLEGGATVTVVGENFRKGTVITIDGRPLLNQELVIGDNISIRGTVPAGNTPGPVDVAAEDGRGRSVLSGAMTYVLEAVQLLSPRQGEASNAEGTARFNWYNPVSYSRINVLDDNDELVATLEGDTTFFEIDSGGRDNVALSFQGVSGGGDTSQDMYIVAVQQDCDTPPPLDALVYEIEKRFDGLEYEDVEFSLYGFHPEPPALNRCVAGGDGGGAALITQPRTGSLEPGLGNIQRPSGLGPLPQSEAVTGFTLDRPASKLEFAVHYRKLAAAAGVRLRGHLIHTFPDDGFEDIFSFPLTTISATNDWGIVTYFRADSDVGRVLEGPEDPGPQPCPGGEGCGGLEIPAGDYVLKLYAVEGDPKVPYYAVSGNPDPSELLIAGTPCPPYPLVRVRDISEEATLPQVSSVNVTKLTGIGSLCPIGKIRTRLTAQGFWLDICNNVHVLDSYDSRFEFSWKIFDGAVPTTTAPSHRTWIDLCLDCGCYEVEITVRRTGCPVTRVYRREIVVEPPGVTCTPGRSFDFLYPQPEPAGTVGIIGLNVPGAPLGTGYADERPLSFQILVSPNDGCGGPGDGIVEEGDIEFDIGQLGRSPFRLGVPFTVDDDCPNTSDGRKYFRVTIDDLGEVNASSRLDSFEGKSLWLLGHAKGTNEAWVKIGGPMTIYNPPGTLEVNSWRGTFSPPGCYLFQVRGSEESEHNFPMGPSADIDIELPDVGDGVSEDISVAGHPSNAVQGGFTSQFSLDGGVWSDEEGVGGLRGNVMANDITGAPLQVEGDASSGNGGGAGGGSLPSYEWCSSGNIFNYEFKEDIYKGILYTGTIWVIPVTVWATIGFGFFINVDYQVTFKLHPFAVVDGFDAVCDQYDVEPCDPLEPENCKASFADAWMYVLMTAGISIPAAIRADILFGVASIAITLEPRADFHMTPWIETHAELPEPKFQPHMDLGARFKLFVSMEACIFWELLCVQVPDPAAAIIDEPIFSCPNPPFDCVAPGCIETCAEEGEGGFVDRFMNAMAQGDDDDDDGGGAGLPGVFSIYELISIPETIYSPSGETYLDIWMSADESTTGILNIRQRGFVDRDFIFTFDGPNPYFLDPSGAFIQEEVALLGFTETNGNNIEIVPPLDVNSPGPYLGPANRNAARANIRVHVVDSTTLSTALLINSGVDISETSEDIADWRTDGMASLAGMPDTGDAWVTWVRYQEDFLADHGTSTTRVYCRENCDPRQPFTTQVVRDLRPQLTTTAIFARQITHNTQDGVMPVSGMFPISNPGINIEPDAAALADGSHAACVWVHDGIHDNLTDDNRGRELHFSLWDRVSDTWSSPANVVLPETLADYPGILEPRIAIKRNQDGFLEGLVAFTAVPEDAEPDDTGLGGLRYLYTVRMMEEADGSISFDRPLRIRGRCDAVVYVWDYEIGYDLGGYTASPLNDLLLTYGPDAVVVFQCRGIPGTQASAGDVLITTMSEETQEWSDPVCVTGSDRTITNTVAAVSPLGTVHALYLDQGASSAAFNFGAQVGLGGGAGAEPRGYQSLDCPLEPDLAITSCILSNQFGGPGAMVRAKIRVENLGFAGSPVDSAGRSVPRIEIVYHSEDGKGPERVAASTGLPELRPGMEHDLEIIIEMPHEPVRLEARLVSNTIDRNITNNSKQCDFGAPTPLNVRCQMIQINDIDGLSVPAILVEWINPVKYDEIFIYRDGLLLTTLPGTSHRHVDLSMKSGSHLYEIRGCVGASRSARAGCTTDEEPPVTGFRRGDGNGDGGVDISDAVFGLGFLFLGGPEPECFDAADANDDGGVDISDAVSVLNYLFLGGVQPPSPGPEICGPDATADKLPECNYSQERC